MYSPGCVLKEVSGTFRRVTIKSVFGGLQSSRHRFRRSRGCGPEFPRTSFRRSGCVLIVTDMFNPYESPTIKNQGNLPRPYVWQQQLLCPVCGENSTSVGRACLLHPQFKIRCRACGVPSRLRFERSDWLRIQVAWIVAVGIAVALLATMLLVDPFATTDRLLRRLMPNLLQNLEAGGYGDLIPPGIALLLLLLTVIPIVVASLMALMVNLRMIAFRSQLEPSDH